MLHGRTMLEERGQFIGRGAEEPELRLKRTKSMEWTQLKVTGRTENRDDICAVMCMLDNGLMIEDYSDIDMDTVYADLIDAEILKKDKGTVSVSIFLPEEKSIVEAVSYLRQRFEALDITVDIETVGVDEEEWATAWKKYYKPVKIGRRLVVVPEWETYDAQPDEIVITMDPGMAFGTGTHETTRLCARLLEKYIGHEDRMLDLGTGSGILTICAAMLGAGHCFACDIDPVAVRVAGENIKLNGVGSIASCAVSDLLKEVPRVEGGYTAVAANIVADVILRMAPELPEYLAEGAVVVASGIIDERAEEVREAMISLGFAVKDEVHENGWCAYAFKW